MSAPRRLTPAFYERPWGLDNLAPWFDEKRPGKKLGEAWFTTDPPLPILPKFLFTSENLSVQVHPDGEWGVGKTEMWHILEARPGARISLGFTQFVSPEKMREAALSGEIERLLRSIPVKPGETYFVPAGTVHAIGAGVTICEIQQNSDITYRMFDYGRGRELHLDAGIAVTNLDAWRHPGASSEAPMPDGWTRLAGCRFFATDSLGIEGAIEYQPDPRRFELLICVAGAGQLNGERFEAGAVWHVPPDCGPVRIAADSAVGMLRSYVP